MPIDHVLQEARPAHATSELPQTPRGHRDESVSLAKWPQEHPGYLVEPSRYRLYHHSNSGSKKEKMGAFTLDNLGGHEDF